MKGSTGFGCCVYFGRITTQIKQSVTPLHFQLQKITVMNKLSYVIYTARFIFFMKLNFSNVVFEIFINYIASLVAYALFFYCVKSTHVKPYCTAL